MSKYDELAKLKDLFNDGMLTVEEFESEKAKLLAKDDDVPAPIQKDNIPQPQPQPQPQSQPQQQPTIVINNTNTNANFNSNVNAVPMAYGRMKNKWVALLLCVFAGFFGAHKFYEGKILMGVVYIFTGGLALIGVIIDFFALLFKPNPYFV